MDKAELKKRIAGLTKEERKELVQEIADFPGTTREDRDNLAALFSGIERERLAGVSPDGAGGKTPYTVPKADGNKSSFLDDL